MYEDSKMPPSRFDYLFGILTQRRHALPEPVRTDVTTQVQQWMHDFGAGMLYPEIFIEKYEALLDAVRSGRPPEKAGFQD